MLFFFFQAEDGIRDLTVTGVQTCALPIWPRPARIVRLRPSGALRGADAEGAGRRARAGAARRRRRGGALPARGRSEERRVGKECRSRVSPYREQRKRHLLPACTGVTEASR